MYRKSIKIDLKRDWFPNRLTDHNSSNADYSRASNFCFNKIDSFETIAPTFTMPDLHRIKS